MTRATLGATTARPSHGSGGLDGLLLDIGGEVGALVVYADPVFEGREIEVRPADITDAPRIHTVVREHRSGVVAAVFVELIEGRYELLHPDDDRRWAEIRIEGGRIAEIDRRTS